MENNLVKEEWINGIAMSSHRPDYNHMELEDSIGNKLKSYFKESCKVAIESALFLIKENPSEIKKNIIKLRKIVTGKEAELVPDIAIYCDKEQRFKRGFLGIPQLIVEVLSPSNLEDDILKKKDLYEQYGVPEYWIASPISKKVYVYNLENNRYKLQGEFNFLKEKIRSGRFENLLLDITDIELLETDEDDI